MYPDTSIVSDRPILIMIYPNNFSFLDSKKKFEDILPRDTIIIFIMNKDTVDRYSWGKIKSDYNILKRLDLNINDIKKQDWTVEYP